MNENEAWFDRAQAVIPGGVDSPVRSFRSVGGLPYTVASGNGAYVTDMDGTTTSTTSSPMAPRCLVTPTPLS